MLTRQTCMEPHTAPCEKDSSPHKALSSCFWVGQWVRVRFGLLQMNNQRTTVEPKSSSTLSPETQIHTRCTSGLPVPSFLIFVRLFFVLDSRLSDHESVLCVCFLFLCYIAIAYNAGLFSLWKPFHPSRKKGHALKLQDSLAGIYPEFKTAHRSM